MNKFTRKIVLLMFVLIGLGIIGFSTNIYAKNSNTGDNQVLSQKFSAKKLDRINASIKTHNSYRFLIDSNQGLDSIKDFFIAGDKKAKVKKLGQNTYMVKLPLNTTFLRDELTQIDSGILPLNIGGYDVVQPEIVEGFGFNIPILNPFPLVKEKGATLGTLPLLIEGNSTGSTIKVGVLDTGIDYTHIDLTSKYNSLLSYDFINEDTDAMDDNGHGTQVSGLIKDSELVGLKVLDANGLGTTYDILEAIDYAKINNIKVINMSFGGIGDASTSAVCQAITDAKNAGIYTVVSAGNSNTDITNLVPASCADSITVGSTTSPQPSPSQGEGVAPVKANFSNYGTGVMLYAPGVDIYSTSLNNTYTTVSGTSFSAAFVSGLVAKELAFSGGISYGDLVSNLKQNYNLVGSFNIENTGKTNTYSTPIEFGSGVFVLPENMDLYYRFQDFKYLSIDNEYVYYYDIKKTGKIYRLKLNNKWIKVPENYYRLNSKIIFSNKDLIFPYYFNTGDYINISDYNNPELIQSFSGTNYTTNNFSSNQFTPVSLGKNNIGLKFDKITGKKLMDLKGYPSYNEGTYIYYINNNDSNKLYRIKSDGTDINPYGTKIIDISYSYFSLIDNQYIYYQNPNDNYKLYKVKKDGSESNIGGNKLVDINYSWGQYVDEQYIYYQNPNDNYKLYRIKKDGSETNTGGTVVIGSEYSSVKSFEGDYIYYQNSLDEFKIYRIKNDGSESNTGGLKISDTPYSWYQVSDELYIYYINSSDENKIYRIKKDGTESNIGGSKVIDIQYLWINYYDDTYLYFTNSNDNYTTYRIKKDGSESNTGGLKISDKMYSNILFIQGEYIYITSWNGLDYIGYRLKKDGTESNKISDKLEWYVTNDDTYIYGGNFDSGKGFYKYYKVKKDGTDTNLYIEDNLVYNSSEITLPTGQEYIRINVDKIIPTGTDYKFSLSNNNTTFYEIDNSKLSGTSDIDLISLFGLGFNGKLFYKVEIIGDSNNQTVTPLINSVELFTGEQIAKTVGNVVVYGGASCESQNYYSQLSLYSPTGQLIYSGMENKYFFNRACGGDSMGGYYNMGNSCMITSITETESNYNVNYYCRPYYSRSASMAFGGSYKNYYDWNGVFTVSKAKYDFCAYNSSFCKNPKAPTILKQYVQSPYLEKQEIISGEKIGKYQSGTGIILSADIPNENQKLLKLAVDIYKVGTNTPIRTEINSGSTLSGSQEVTVPYFGTGSFYWKARVVNETGNTSDAVDFGTGGNDVIDYELYEGFEPYPYGFKFPNKGTAYGVLDGGIVNIYNPNEGTDPYILDLIDKYLIQSGSLNNHNPLLRFKYPGNKWEIFNTIFPESSFQNKKKMFDMFESIGLNVANPDIFSNGNCLGLALTAITYNKYPDIFNSYFSDFSNIVGTGSIWNNIDISKNIFGNWNKYDSVLRPILSFQLVNKTPGYVNLKYKSYKNFTATGVLEELKKHPQGNYIIAVSGRRTLSGSYEGHAIVPYRVEGDNIYIWDNNVPYTKESDNKSYKQIIKVNSDGSWSNEYFKSEFGWNYFNNLMLINLDELYGINNNSSIGFNNNDILYTVSGFSDIIVTDTQGRMSGFSSGTIFEEIPGVNVILPESLTLSGGTTENTWKQIYLPQKQDGLTVKVISKTSESYDLLVAGGDYYTKVENVETSTGQIDTYIPTREKLNIDFDDNKTGNYNLLVDDFQNNGTGTVYIDSVISSPNPQLYSISWTGVLDNANDAVNYEVDTNNDGIYDKSTKLSPIFQDLIAPTTTNTFSGTLTAGYSTGSYIETVNINLNTLDNVGGSGIDNTYYAIGTNTGTLEYTAYSGAIIVNGLGDYTLNYYSVDKFGNVEQNKTINFTLTERPETYNGVISGFVYDDANNNGIQETTENKMAGWKVCIDKNNDGTCQENIEPFILTNNDGYYELNGLAKGIYKIIEIPHTNWNITSPINLYYDVNLGIGQEVTNKNFGNYKIKLGKK